MVHAGQHDPQAGPTEQRKGGRCSSPSLNEVLAEHVESDHLSATGQHTVCFQCEQPWPCAAIRAASSLEAYKKFADDVVIRAQDAYLKAERLYDWLAWIDRLKEERALLARCEEEGGQPDERTDGNG